MTPFMWLAAATAAIGGFLYGYDTGIIAGALLSITKDFALPHAMQEIVAAAILFGATLGGLGTGVVSDRFGRRHTIIGIAALFALGAIAASLAPDAVLLALARVILGIAVGAASQ